MKQSELKAIAENFERTLPFRDEPYSKKNWGNNLHSLCSYQGKLKPAMAYWLVEAFVPNGGSVLDPIGGVGTISFEAALKGMRTVSNDLSPFASTVANGKLCPPNLQDAIKIWDELWADIARVELTDEDFIVAEFGLNGKVRDFYHPQTLVEVLQARKIFNQRKDWTSQECFLWASVLHILHGNRPYALSRTSHPITPFNPTGLFEYKSVYLKVVERIKRALKNPLPEIFSPGLSKFGDFRGLDAAEIGKFDAIITSPPFLGMRFDRPNWLRLWFCGWLEENFLQESQKFLERQQLKSSDCYTDLIVKSTELLHPGGVLVIHIGSGDARKRRLDQEIKLLAVNHFNLIRDIREDVRDVEQHGIKDKGMTTHHHLLVFQKE